MSVAVTSTALAVAWWATCPDDGNSLKSTVKRYEKSLRSIAACCSRNVNSGAGVWNDVAIEASLSVLSGVADQGSPGRSKRAALRRVRGQAASAAGRTSAGRG